MRGLTEHEASALTREPNNPRESLSFGSSRNQTSNTGHKGQDITGKINTHRDTRQEGGAGQMERKIRQDKKTNSQIILMIR